MERLNTILLATDLSEASEGALRHAALIAAKNDATIHALHVRVPYAASLAEKLHTASEAPDFHRAIDDAASKVLKGYGARFSAPLVTKIVSDYDAADAICAYAEGNEVELIIVGTHRRRGLERLFLGSVAARVIERASVPVLVVPADLDEGPGERFGTILAPVDFSDASLRSLRLAKQVATRHGARLIAAHIVEDVPHPAFYYAGSDRILEVFPDLTKRVRERLQKAAGDEAMVVVAEGKPHARIADLARENGADLIVLGFNGLSSVDEYVFGTTSQRTIRSVSCPVWVDKGAVQTR